MQAGKHIVENWADWELEEQKEALLQFQVWLRENSESLKENPQPELFHILKENLYQADVDLRFLSLRLLIVSSDELLEKYQEELIELCIDFLHDSNIPVSDSANWLLNVLGPKGSWALLKDVKHSQGKRKFISLAWLGRNQHVVSSSALEKEVFEVSINALNNSNLELKWIAVCLFMDNSPLREKNLNSFVFSIDYTKIYEEIKTAIHLILERGDESHREFAHSYLTILAEAGY